jgi:hypothetical protein
MNEKCATKPTAGDYTTIKEKILYEHRPVEPWFSNFEGVKRLGYKVSHSPPSSVEFKNEWS